jgi:hypothetical protein
VDDLTLDRWQSFFGRYVAPRAKLRDDQAPFDAFKPGCNDQPSDPGEDSPTIVSRFWSDRSLPELFEFVDPRNWARLGSLYWRRMEPITPLTATPNGFHGTFLEIVALPMRDITAYLDITFWQDEHTACCTFREAQGMNSDVLFDRGYVVATDRTVPPVAPPLPPVAMVQSNKSIVFRDPVLNQLTDLACDNGWVDLMMRMAVPPHRDDPKLAGPSGADPAAADSEVAQWQLQAKQVIDRSVVRATEAAKAVRDGRWDDQLVDSLIAGGTDLTSLAGQAVRAYREVVGNLAARRGEP